MNYVAFWLYDRKYNMLQVPYKSLCWDNPIPVQSAKAKKKTSLPKNIMRLSNDDLIKPFKLHSRHEMGLPYKKKIYRKVTKKMISQLVITRSSRNARKRKKSSFRFTSSLFIITRRKKLPKFTRTVKILLSLKPPFKHPRNSVDHACLHATASSSFPCHDERRC